jgi:hypothetical protein
MTYTAWDKTRDLMVRHYKHTGARIDFDDAETLRRAELTLNRWATEECNGTIQRPWADTPDGDTGPYRPGRLWRAEKGIFSRVPDRQAGALRRIAEVCKRNGLDFYHQGDPRGCSLYIADSGAGMNDTNYSSFVSCAVR